MVGTASHEWSGHTLRHNFGRVAMETLVHGPVAPMGAEADPECLSGMRAMSEGLQRTKI